jgi:hypothetical protein
LLVAVGVRHLVEACDPTRHGSRMHDYQQTETYL